MNENYKEIENVNNKGNYGNHSSQKPISSH